MKKFLFTLLALPLLMVNTAEAKDLSEADVKRIVEQYIKENGGLIANSVDTYLSDERRRVAKQLINENTPTIGAKDAEITFIEFSDYRCGYCRRVQETVNDLRDKYGDKVTFAFKYLPILSQESQDAALAAAAAKEQGKFWEFHAELWDNQANLGEKLFTETAEKLKLDMKQFNADRKSEKIAEIVGLDAREGQGAGAQGTPFFIVDGEPLSGAQPFSAFEKAIEAAIARSEDK